MAIPDPPKAGSPFCALWTGGWNPKTPKINNFFIPEITLRGGYETPLHDSARNNETAEIAQMLIAAGANVEAKTRVSST